MKNTELIYIKDIVNEYGKDLSEFDLSNKIFSKFDFSDIILPKDFNLFQRIKNKDISECSFNYIDFNNYNLSEVDIRGVKFKDGVILPQDYNIFQKIKDKDLSNVYLPSLNYSKYNFNNVSIMGTKFGEDSVLSANEDFFQNVKNKNLNFTILPKGDYSRYNFEGVSMYYTKFGENSLMSKDYSLFKKIAMIKESDIVDNCSENIHLYDLKDIPYNLRISGIDDVQSVLIYKRFIECNKNSKIKINNFI